MNTIGALASRLSESRRGVVWFLFAILVFSTMDVVAKHLTAHYPIPQIVWARHTVPLLVLAVVLNRRLPGVLASRRVGRDPRIDRCHHRNSRDGPSSGASRRGC